MEVKQVYELVNAATKEVLGETVVLNEDLSNVVDIGEAIFNASAVDAYCKSIVNKVGRVIFVNRVYSGSVPSVLRDSWEYGSVLEKITAEMPEAVENESWELQDGTSYDPNIFHAPKVSAKFFNRKVTFEIEMSFCEIQVKQSFTSATQLNGFISMLYNTVDKAMTVKIDSLIQRAINVMMAETIYSDYEGAALSSKSGIKAVNLLYLYNEKNGTTLTAVDALTDPSFIRFAAYTIGIYQERLTKISKLFNIEGKDRFTSKDMQHIVLLADFAKAADAYLQSDVYHNELVKLPEAEVVPYWQGSGTDYGFESISKIDVKTPNNNTVTATGILGMIWDRDAIAVTNLDRRVTTSYNPKGEFYNNFYKFDCGEYVDMQENAVVFFVA